MGLRPLKEEDYADLVKLWKDAGLSWDWGDDQRSYVEAVRRFGQHYWGYQWNDRLIGCVLGAFDGRRGWIYHLAVADPFRRRGIGRLLMQAAERSLRQQGCQKINLLIEPHNLEVAAFYQALGYQAVANQFMEKPLLTLTPPNGASGEIV